MKTLKKVLTVVMTLVLLLTGFVVLPVQAEGEGFTAKLGYSDPAWGVQEWGDKVNTTVTGAGTYTLSWDLAEGQAVNSAVVFVVDIVGAGADFAAQGIALKDLKVKVDGADLAVDMSKVVTGDIEENGNFRIEIYNEYGTTKDAAPIDKATLVAAKNLTVEFTLAVAGNIAKLGYADPAWGVQEWGDNVNVNVNGSGTYTLSWDLAEGQAVNSAVVFVVDVVGASADLLADGKKINLTDLKVKVDGADLAVDMSKVVTGDIEENGNYRIEIYNEYGTTKEAPSIDITKLVAAKNLTVEFTVDVVSAGYTTKLGYADPAWGVQEWGDNVNTVVTGAGSYNLTWNIPEGSTANSAVVFVVDVVGAGADLLADGKAFNLTDLKVTADGTALAVDMSKVVTGDIEENGNYRIEIYNEYGKTKEAAPIDIAKIVASKTLAIDFTLEVIDAPTATPEETTPAAPAVTFDPAGKYNAYLGLQTPNWTYRDAWNSANGIGSEYWGSFIYGNETKKQYGVVTDVEVAGNGTYSVKLTDFGSIISDDFTTAKQDYFNLLYISTDIPLSENIKITDAKVIMDGKTIKTFSDAYLDPDEKEYVKILFQNIWNNDVKELPFYLAPTSSIEMKFTISGFNYDNEAAGEEQTTPAPTTPASNVPADEAPSGNILPIVIAVVAAVAVVAVVAVVVLKKKKANK